MLALSAVNRGFEPRSGQIKDYKIGICCFSTKHAALRRKSKNLLARNQDNVSEWDDMSICGLLLQGQDNVCEWGDMSICGLLLQNQDNVCEWGDMSNVCEWGDMSNVLEWGDMSNVCK